MSKHRSEPESSNPPEPEPNGPKWSEMGENGGEFKKSTLNFRQQSALPIIAAAPSLAQAVRASGIPDTTLRRWLEDDRFRNELTRLREESANLARNELQGLMLRCVSVLAEALEDPDKDYRLRAARYAMSFANKVSDSQEILKKVDALEQSLPVWAAHHSMK